MRRTVWFLALLFLVVACGRYGGSAANTVVSGSDIESPRWVAVAFWKSMYLAVDMGTALQLTEEAKDTYNGQGGAAERKAWLQEVDRRVQAIRTPPYEITEQKRADGRISYSITTSEGNPKSVRVTVSQHPAFGWQVVSASP